MSTEQPSCFRTVMEKYNILTVFIALKMEKKDTILTVLCFLH